MTLILENYVLEIVPESDFHTIWQVMIDRLSCLVRADKEKHQIIKEGGLPVFISLKSKGHNVWIDEGLESTLLATFRNASYKDNEGGEESVYSVIKASVKWLKKILRNHHSKQPQDAFSVTFNACNSLKNPEEIIPIWHGMRSLFVDCDHPVVRTVDALMLGKGDFDEIIALLQAKAFLQLNTSNKDPSFKITLTGAKQIPIVRIDIGGSFLQLPFDPVNAFRILHGSKNDKIIALMKTFLYPNEPYLAGKKLPIDWMAFAKMTDDLANKDYSLARELRIISSIKFSNESPVDLFIDDLPHLLTNPRLNESVEHMHLLHYLIGYFRNIKI